MMLNLGCGNRRLDGYVNIDCRPEVRPDLVCDISSAGLPFADNSVDAIRAYDFLEHVPTEKTIFVMEEIYRTLRPKGSFFGLTPSTDGRGAFQDPTHRSFWNVNSWFYFMDDSYRSLYGIRAKFSGRVFDVTTNPHCSIIHTRCDLVAEK